MKPYISHLVVPSLHMPEGALSLKISFADWACAGRIGAAAASRAAPARSRVVLVIVDLVGGCTHP
jgi:hypothetical protein